MKNTCVKLLTYKTGRIDVDSFIRIGNESNCKRYKL